MLLLFNIRDGFLKIILGGVIMLNLSNHLQLKENELKKEFLSFNFLINLFGKFLGVDFGQVSNARSSFFSKAFDTRKISGVFLKELKSNNFSLDYRDDGVITLSDDNKQKERGELLSSNYWNFRNNEEKKDPLILEMRIRGRLDGKERGIHCYPCVTGSFLSPADHLPQWRVFKILFNIIQNNETEGCKKIVRDIAQSEKGVVFVSWSDISNSYMHLSGIRTISKLFGEFIRGHENLQRLISTCPHLEIFSFIGEKEDFFVSEHLHLEIFDLWKEELNEFIFELKIY